MSYEDEGRLRDDLRVHGWEKLIADFWVRCRETFGGPLAIMVKLAVGSTLVERLGDYGRDIKAFIESGGDVEGGASVVGGEPAASEE